MDPHPHPPSRTWSLLFVLVCIVIGAVAAIALLSGNEPAISEEPPRSGSRRPPTEAPPSTAPPLPPLCIGDIWTAASDVFFELDRADLRPGIADMIVECVPKVTQHLAQPGTTVEVHAFTDGLGSDAHNLRLAAARAQSVIDVLVVAGVPADRLLAIPHGEEGAVDDLADPDRRKTEVHLA
jgi:outer membrane protein OmpA-like peptidoglycan-associated protein